MGAMIALREARKGRRGWLLRHIVEEAAKDWVAPEGLELFKAHCTVGIGGEVEVEVWAELPVEAAFVEPAPVEEGTPRTVRITPAITIWVTLSLSEGSRPFPVGWNTDERVVVVWMGGDRGQK